MKRFALVDAQGHVENVIVVADGEAWTADGTPWAHCALVELSERDIAEAGGSHVGGVFSRAALPERVISPEEKIAVLEKENTALRDALIEKGVITQAEVDAKAAADASAETKPK